MIRSMNVHFGRFKMDGLAFIDQRQAEKLNNVIVQELDVLLNITGASIGRVTVAPPELANARVNQHVCIIRPNEKIIPRYLEAFLASPITQRLIDERQVGATREALTKTMIERFRIPVPSLDKQLRVVAKIDLLMAQCDELERLTARRDSLRLASHRAAMSKLLALSDKNGHIQSREFLSRHFHELYTVKENVTELRKAILQLAVIGKLVPRDPTDPPAIDLLEQIEIERRRLVKEGKVKEPRQQHSTRATKVPYVLPQGWEWVRESTSSRSEPARHHQPQIGNTTKVRYRGTPVQPRTGRSPMSRKVHFRKGNQGHQLQSISSWITDCSSVRPG